MNSSATIMAVAITTRNDCSWTDIGGAQILVGPRAFMGPQDALPISSFKLCATIAASGIPRGQRLTYDCVPPLGLTGQYIAVYLPKKSSRLTLCEVDVITEAWLLQAAAGSSSAAAASAPSSSASAGSIITSSSGRRRLLAH